MAYVNVADWKAEQVAEWLKGLDGVVLQYIRLFVDKNINGQQLLDLQPNDLEDIGVTKIGHQEIILEAIDLLKNFYYDLDRENLQLLALRLSCLSHSLLSELRKNHMNSSVVSTQVLADVANVVSAVKPLVCWLDRRISKPTKDERTDSFHHSVTPFCDQLSYVDRKTELSKLSVEMAMSGMRDRFAEKPIDNIRQSCKQLAELADSFIQGIDDSLLLQPASLDLATLKKRPGDHLGFYIVPSFNRILQVGELKCNSAAHQCGKIETGDEIVQINYQTVVGWEVKEVMSLLFEESSTEVLMTLKKRPRHSKVFGQIYIKPYRLPCKKQMSYSTKWNDLLSPSRPELLSVPSHLGWPFRTISVKPTTVSVKENPETKPPPSPTPSTASSISSRSSENELIGPSSPNSVRLYLPKPRIPVQRRATITGASPVSKHAPLSLEQFWHELKLEREWRSNSDEKTEKVNSETQLKRAAPTTHCSLNWSARLCEQSPDSSQSRISMVPEKEKAEREASAEDENGIIPLRQRIDSLNRAIEQNGQTVKKPKLLPKPILSSKAMVPPKSDALVLPLHVPSTPKETECASTRRERNKLDKSYSTPSYDYSLDSKEPLTFTMKLPEEKVRSAPDNITTEVERKSEYKKLEAEPVETQQPLEAPTKNLEQIKENDQPGLQQSTRNMHPEIKKEGTQEAEVRVNTILDTIESTLKIDNESDTSPPGSTKEATKNVFDSKPPNYFTFEHSSIMPYTSSSSKLDTDSLRMEDVSSITSDTLRSNASDASQPIERLHIHTTININVPSTFPRHKMEHKKAYPPPEPPPRPAKSSPIHSKFSKSSSIAKSSIKSPPHKSPKVTRKKNVWLTKRRNVSVKDLGVCDHEGWLYHRSRKMARGSPQWIKGWFIIKGTIFYGFNTREASHARLMISLPGFTVSPAEEVKSRNFSFKVYHDGTTFYFAAESGEDLQGWVESFQRVTISDEEKSIVVSETDGEEDDESQPAKKEKSGGESSSSHLAAMRKLSGLIAGHLGGMHDSKNSDKKFNSLKKVSSSRKSSKEDQPVDNNSHIASLDRKYLKFFGGSRSQNFNPVPTAQFRSYRRVPPMEKPPFGESSLSTDSDKSDSLAAAPVLSASPTRPPEMADYRLASLAKCPNQRTPENAPPGGHMTLESFMLSRQEEERRHQSQHPRATNILRVPQCQAPPPPTPLILHSVVAATGHDLRFLPRASRPPIGPSTSGDETWPELCSYAPHSAGGTSSVVDVRPKHLKKTALYQPPPWDPPVQRLNDDVRLQPAFEMTLDRQQVNENTTTGNSKNKKTDVSSSSSLRFKNLFGSSKTDAHKSNLISSPRLRRVLFRDKKNSSQVASSTDSTHENAGFVSSYTTAPLVAAHPPEIRLPNAPDYPGLQYPPIFEPGSYSLSDVSNLLRSTRVRSFDYEGEEAVEATSVSETSGAGLGRSFGDSLNNNTFSKSDQDENQNPNGDDNGGFSFTTV